MSPPTAGPHGSGLGRLKTPLPAVSPGSSPSSYPRLSTPGSWCSTWTTQTRVCPGGRGVHSKTSLDPPRVFSTLVQSSTSHRGPPRRLRVPDESPQRPLSSPRLSPAGHTRREYTTPEREVRDDLCRYDTNRPDAKGHRVSRVLPERTGEHRRSPVTGHPRRSGRKRHTRRPVSSDATSLSPVKDYESLSKRRELLSEYSGEGPVRTNPEIRSPVVF